MTAAETAAQATPVEDAVVVEETAAAADEPGDTGAAVLRDDAVAGATTRDDSGDKGDTDGPAEPEPTAVITPAPQRRGGFAGMVAGGVAAAVLGAGALYLAQDQEWIGTGTKTQELRGSVEALTRQVTGLQTALDGAATQLDALAAGQSEDGAMARSIAALRSADADAADELAAVSRAMDELRARLEKFQAQPIPKAELPAEVVAAYEAQLADVLDAVDARFVELQATLDGKLAEIEAAQAAAARAEQDAVQAADVASAQAAMSRIMTALESGGEFSGDLDILSEKTGLNVPPVLSRAAVDGVPTRAELTEEFPDAARRALVLATEAAAAEGAVSPVAAFLRTQLGARSLSPREGDDADAVLSRAEAAVGRGDLATAMTEIDALPQAGRAALAAWVEKAEFRRDALTAAADVSAQLNSN